MPSSKRRSSSPIQKQRVETNLGALHRASTFPSTSTRSNSSQQPLHNSSYTFVSPFSCFTDDNALELLLSGSFPADSSQRTKSISETTSEVTLCLADPLSTSRKDTSVSKPIAIPPNLSDTMSISEDNSNPSSPDQITSQPPIPANSEYNNNTTNNNSNPRRAQRGRRTAPTSSLRCDICNQLYSRRDNLRAHQRVHTGDKPYQCRFCGQYFRWLGALRNHEGNHIRDGDTPLNPPPPSSRQPAQTSARVSCSTTFIQQPQQHQPQPQLEQPQPQQPQQLQSQSQPQSQLQQQQQQQQQQHLPQLQLHSHSQPQPQHPLHHQPHGNPQSQNQQHRHQQLQPQQSQHHHPSMSLPSLPLPLPFPLPLPIPQPSSQTQTHLHTQRYYQTQAQLQAHIPTHIRTNVQTHGQIPEQTHNQTNPVSYSPSHSRTNTHPQIHPQNFPQSFTQSQVEYNNVHIPSVSLEQDPRTLPSQRISPQKSNLHLSEMELRFNEPSGNAAGPSRDVVVTEEDPNVNPLFPILQESWGPVFDDFTPEDRSRDQ